MVQIHKGLGSAPVPVEDYATCRAEVTGFAC